MQRRKGTLLTGLTEDQQDTSDALDLIGFSLELSKQGYSDEKIKKIMKSKLNEVKTDRSYARGYQRH